MDSIHCAQNIVVDKAEHAGRPRLGVYHKQLNMHKIDTTGHTNDLCAYTLEKVLVE